jgi:cytochrome c553
MVNTARLSAEKSPAASRYALNTGTSVQPAPDAAADSSRLIAWDPSLGKAVWTLERSYPLASGVLATAGNLVFQGSMTGSLEALHADTGKTLWQADAGASIAAAPISYQVDDAQLIAVVAGAGGKDMLQGGTQIAALAPQTHTPRILAYSLNGTATLPAAVSTNDAASTPDSPPLPEPFGTPADIRHGANLYAKFCARCHGEETISAGPLKALTKSERLSEEQPWQLAVYAGQLTASGMPGFMAELKPTDVEAIRAFVIQQAHAQH